MDSLVTDCQKCRSCCRFERDELYFAPLFAQQEIDALDARAAEARFRPHQGSREVLQLELVEKEGRFICPFLDEAGHLCRIYPLRPFDCRIWPHVVMRGRSGETLLGRLGKDRCPATSPLSPEQLSAQSREVVEWLDREPVRRLLERYPGLIWPLQDDAEVLTRLF